MSLEFVFSEKGNKKLLLKGFLFVKDKTVDEKTYWKCEHFLSKKCRSRAITRLEDVCKETSHNHPADAAEVEAVRLKNKLKDDARSTRDTPHYLVSALSSEVDQLTAAKLSKINTLKRTVRRERVKQNMEPTQPKCLEELDIPESFKTTAKGKPFLLFDSGKVKQRIQIFSTKDNLAYLQEADNIYMDGTFKTVPMLFYQLYTVHAIINEESIPLVYALLPDKSKDTYIKLISALKGLAPSLKPQSVLIDFELAMIGAIKQEFPNTSIQGCFFHFSQAIYRKIQAAGLREKYNTEKNFAQKMKLLCALAFVPTKYVQTFFDALSDSFPEEATEVLDYYEETWIGMVRRNRRRPPLFDWEMWNCTDNVLNSQPKTNNHIEGWHLAFESQLSASHPTIWKFIAAIQREQSLSEFKISQFNSGTPATSRKVKYMQLNTKLKNIIDQLSPEDPLKYLNSIACNLSYN